MTENKESRIKVEDLPQAEQELTADEAKTVKGGIAQVWPGGALGYRESDFNFALKAGDGSVTPQGNQGKE